MKVDIAEKIRILYDKENPSESLAMNGLIGSPLFDQIGIVYSAKPWSLIGFLILPLFMLTLHLLWSRI